LVDLTLQESRRDGLSHNLGSSYRVVWTGRGGGRSHELKCSFRLTHPRERAASNTLHVHCEARIASIAKSLLAPGNGATRIACQVRVMSRLEKALCPYRGIRCQLGRPVQSPGGGS
jgi:hypothetical protein